MFRNILDARLKGSSGQSFYHRRSSVVTWVSFFVEALECQFSMLTLSQASMFCVGMSSRQSSLMVMPDVILDRRP